jgi:hypothetical protein
MWGTDGVRIETVDDGWVWVFSAVDHCDACCVGIHAVKTGNRFAALQPIAQGLLGEFGGTGAEVGRGLTLRMDSNNVSTSFSTARPVTAVVGLPERSGAAKCSRRSDPRIDRPYLLSFPGPVGRPGTPNGEVSPRRCM